MVIHWDNMLEWVQRETLGKSAFVTYLTWLKYWFSSTVSPQYYFPYIHAFLKFPTTFLGIVGWFIKFQCYIGYYLQPFLVNVLPLLKMLFQLRPALRQNLSNMKENVISVQCLLPHCFTSWVMWGMAHMIVTLSSGWNASISLLFPHWQNLSVS